MAQKLDGKKLAQEIELRLKDQILKGKDIVNRSPGLAVIRVGDDPASGVYIANKEKACSRIGINSFVFHFDENTSSDELIKKIEELNLDEKIDGILLQLPIPSHLDDSLLVKKISPNKDVDGLHPLNLGKLLKGEKGPRSCTPAGVMALLSSNAIELEGKRAVVIGRSILVGKPMALMLEAANATVTIAHSKTKELESLTRQADLVVVAAGKPNLIGEEHIQKNAVVIDVGIHRFDSGSNEKGQKIYKLCGDVKSHEVALKASALTPVPGGVGPMTVSMLLVNSVCRWQENCGLPLTLDDLLS